MAAKRKPRRFERFGGSGCMHPDVRRWLGDVYRASETQHGGADANRTASDDGGPIKLPTFRVLRVRRPGTDENRRRISEDGYAITGSRCARIGRERFSFESPAFPNGNPRVNYGSSGGIFGRPGAIYEREPCPFERDCTRFKNCRTNFKEGRAPPEDDAPPPEHFWFRCTNPRASRDHRRFRPERIRVSPIGDVRTPKRNRGIFDA
jgi:hypothetical protein